jgi:hypothetical protein
MVKGRFLQVFLIPEGLELVFRLVFKTSGGRITPSVAGSIPALSVGGVSNGVVGFEEV